jgi:hypothetical protein
MTKVTVSLPSPSEQHAPPAVGRRLAFVEVELPADRVAAEKIADGVRDVARALWVVHDTMGLSHEAALITVLAERLECEAEALDALLAMEVMVEAVDEERPAGEPNLSLRLAPAAGGKPAAA